MAFAIAHPIGKTYADPTRLPRKFIAVGTKLSTETAGGFLVSVNRDGAPDFHLLIGGTPIDVKDAKGQLDPTKWALRFDLTGVRPGVRFSLQIYDKGGLTGTITEMVKVAAATDGKAADEKARRNPERFFAVARPNEKVGPTVAKVGPVPGDDDKRGGFSPEAVNPGTNGSAPHDLFVAYGDLPSGDSGIVINGTAGTKLINSATSNYICAPDFQDGDGQTFWAAFFPVINKTSHPIVDLIVVYSTSNSIETSEEIVLD